MASSDVRDILELAAEDRPNAPPTKARILKQARRKSSRKNENVFKRPEGMHRELYSLLYSDNRDQPPLIPTDTSQEYQTAKAKLGCKVVRPWRWMPFTNPGRKDSAVFYHWRRAEDEGKDYPFAKFNKSVQVPVYSDQEYQLHLAKEDWTREETDQLFESCRRFDLRWFVVHDRYDHQRFSSKPSRTIEDMKERYYNICNILEKLRAAPGQPDSPLEQYVYDGDHERRRKDQLDKLFERTREQVVEEEILLQELKKIESRKRERERKAQDLQKLIAAADSGTDGIRRAERKSVKKKLATSQLKKGETAQESKVSEVMSGIKFPDFKGTGVMLRSQRMKLPTSFSLKKIKAIEQLITDFNIDPHPMPTPTVAQLFNEVRSDYVLLYDLKMAHVNCEMELQTLRYKWDVLAPGRIQPTGTEIKMDTASTQPVSKETETSQSIKMETEQSGFATGSDSNEGLIDVVNTSTTQRKQTPTTNPLASNKKMKS
ncbi:DNA methyltransferase 1-associated protein 1-like [Styela clava]|uniref:DNA methyltransferase 1-associated protein 1-like n=1 Tax=Styela clava TaxID=7725 RepID=UPI001939AE9E|nr:DNA methyltransferase 1-associated protein 1-like [Styela clava]